MHKLTTENSGKKVENKIQHIPIDMRCPTNVMRMFCIFKIIREHRIPHFMNASTYLQKYNRTFAVPQIDIRQTSLTLTLTNYAKHRLVQFHNVPKRRTTEAKNVVMANASNTYKLG